MRKINRISCGNVNCYVIHQNGKSILVDTSRIKYRDKLLEVCKRENVALIVLTHGHVDHVQNAAYLSRSLGIPIAMHKSDYQLIKNNTLQALTATNILGKFVLALSEKSFEQDEIELFEPTVFLQEGDNLISYGIDANVVDLPGHTQGSIGLSVWGENFIVGDALMNIFYPSKSMLYNNLEEMEKSAAKIFKSGAKTIYFGHGRPVNNRKW